jgi:hypothetical protein
VCVLPFALLAPRRVWFGAGSRKMSSVHSKIFTQDLKTVVHPSHLEPPTSARPSTVLFIISSTITGVLSTPYVLDTCVLVRNTEYFQE